MSKKKAKKISFFTALTMMVGSIIGIGIFFKNDGILKANDWNGWSTLMSWVVGGLLSAFAAISFSEMGSMKLGKVKSLMGWAEATSGVKAGYFVRFNYSFLYYGMYTFVMGAFSGEITIKMFEILGVIQNMDAIPIYVSIFTGLGFSIFFILMNFYSAHVGGMFQVVTTILKWIPLLVVGVVGIAFASTNLHPSDGIHHGSGFIKKYGHDAFFNGSSFTFTGLLAALPAVLFSFDSFLNAANMHDKMKNPHKLPLVIVVGIISCLMLYLFIAVAAILHGTGNISGGKKIGTGIFDQIFSTSTSEKLAKFTYVFLAISTLGAANGIIASGVSIIEQSVLSKTIFGSKTLKKRFGIKKTTLIIIFVNLIIWALIISLPAIIMDSDVFIDGASNFPTLFFFSIYGFVIFKYTRNRHKYNTDKMNNLFYKIISWMAIFGIGFVIGYQLIYGFLIHAIIDPHYIMSWGLMETNGFTAEAWQSMILFFVYLLIFIIAPFINKWLLKKFENENAYKDTLNEVHLTKKEKHHIEEEYKKEKQQQKQK